MSAEDDALRDMAVNRGCRLVKSRRRKPGGDFGRYGLKDAKTGKEVFGFGDKGLTATVEEIQSYLRGGAVAGWKRSLITAVDSQPPPAKRKRPEPPPPEPRRKRTKTAKGRPAEARGKAAAKRPAAEKPKRRAPEPEPKASRKAAKRRTPEPPKPPKIREAKPGDSEVIAGLLAGLGYDVSAADLRKRLKAMRKADEPPLVADRDGVIGCLTWHVTPVLHRPRPVGRITMLVVAEGERGGGIGTTLVAEAEARLRKRGCGLLEVTSNMRRMRAHAFYEKLGFERTSYRFAKSLVDEA